MMDVCLRGLCWSQKAVAELERSADLAKGGGGGGRYEQTEEVGGMSSIEAKPNVA